MNTLWPGCGGLSIIEPLPHTHTHIPPVPCVSSQLPPDPLDGLHTLHPFWGPGPRPRLLLPQALGMAQILPQPRTSLCTRRDIPPPCTHYLVPPPPPHTDVFLCCTDCMHCPKVRVPPGYNPCTHPYPWLGNAYQEY